MSSPTEANGTCSDEEHVPHHHEPKSDRVVARTAEMFKALGDVPRLRLLELLFDGKHCVSELAQETGDSMSMVSQRLKLLCQAGLVTKARAGKHIYYALADEHIFTLLETAFEHTIEHNL